MLRYSLIVLINFYFSARCEVLENLPLQSDVPVEELGDYLVDLDKKILRMLILPEHQFGLVLLTSLDKFYKNYKYLDSLVVLNVQNAFRPAKRVIESECPTFIHELFDMFTLQQTLKWNARGFANFRENILMITALASKFPEDFSKMDVQVETLFEKPLVQQQF